MAAFASVLFFSHESGKGWIVAISISIFTWFDLAAYWTFAYKYWVTSLYVKPDFISKTLNSTSTDEAKLSTAHTKSWRRMRTINISYYVAATFIVLSWATIEIVERFVFESEDNPHEDHQSLNWI